MNLIEASRGGHLDGVNLLLESGSPTNAADANYAIKLASYNGHLQIVKLLIKYANIHDLAIQWASLKGHPSVVKLLLEAGANVHANDNYSIRHASSYGHLKVSDLKN